jgi:hypothetical protein
MTMELQNIKPETDIKKIYDVKKYVKNFNENVVKDSDESN